MEKLDTVIVHRMMPLYFVCAFLKISIRAFTTFLLAPLPAIFLGIGDSCQQEGFFVFRLVLVLLGSSQICRRYKLKYEGQNRPHESLIVYIIAMSHMRKVPLYCTMQLNKTHYHAALPQLNVHMYIYLTP